MSSIGPWRPDVIFFDLDDTLIYEDAVDDIVIVEVVRRLAPRVAGSDGTIIQAVRLAARALWEKSSEIDYCRLIGISAIEGLYGDYSSDDPHLRALHQFTHASGYRVRVWTETLRALGIDDPNLGHTIAIAFAEERSARHIRFPDALPTVERLAKRFRLGLITNGAPFAQRAKFVGSGLAPYFDPNLIVVSGDRGIGKPRPEIYLHALNLAHILPEAALMVGNSLPNDIVGAQNVGTRAIWVDRTGEPLPSIVQPFEVVTTLAEIFPPS